MKETILITGGAGFIGFHLIKRLIKENINVVAVDNLNSYYSIDLKKSRLEELKKLNGQFNFYYGDIEDNLFLKKIFKNYEPKFVVNLAAQAGVRYSLENPGLFLKSNINGFGNILEISKDYEISHLVYASSSSVYGGNKQLPYSENNSVDHPVSIYAASKKSNELMAHAYSHLYSLPATGLRFFTVYGPWGRPDMSYFLFTKAILEDRSIDVFNYGNMERDFTFVDDIIESIIRVLNKIPNANESFDRNSPDISTSWAPHKIFNIGNSNSINLGHFISLLEEIIGKKAKKNFLPMPKGDVQSTLADTKSLESLINFKPKTPIKEGLEDFVKWYKNYYQII
tara:strand:+ start:1360 stop:2379 length:1020 start_codon:yes stop_codon:yes gene_type:complete